MSAFWLLKQCFDKKFPLTLINAGCIGSHHFFAITEVYEIAAECFRPLQLNVDRQIFAAVIAATAVSTNADERCGLNDF